MATTVTPAATASFQLGPFDTLTLSSGGARGSIVLTSFAPKLCSDQTLTPQNGTFGPWGAPMAVVMTITQGSCDYTVNQNSLTPAQAQSAVSGAGISKLVGDQLAAPITNSTSATGAAGALTGAYYYAVTFVSAQGETAPWPGTATVVNPVAQQINLTSIPLGPAGTTARRIYRTPATPTDPKDYRFLVEISDNTTTTYTDNAADGSLGSPVNWSATNRGVITDGSVPIVKASDQSTALGQGTFNTNSGYASVAVGYQALYANTTGRRNTAVGVYALTALTTGYENAAIGVHAGQSQTTGRQSTFAGAYSGYNITTQVGNTFVGYYAGNGAGLGAGSANYNVGVGFQATKGATASGVGDYNVGAGYLALSEMAGVGSCIGIGPWAGRYANNNRQVFIDAIDRANIAGEQNSGLIYGKAENTAQTQVLHLNAMTRLGWAGATVSQLPAASSTYNAFRAHVTDATVAYTSANVGSTVAGGGSNVVPVFCNGTNWVIG